MRDNGGLSRARRVEQRSRQIQKMFGGTGAESVRPGDGLATVVRENKELGLVTWLQYLVCIAPRVLLWVWNCSNRICSS